MHSKRHAQGRVLGRWILQALLLSVVAGSGCRQQAVPQLPEQPEIIWDEWGVPHIFAADMEGVSYAWGWAQATNHGPLLIRLLGEVRGRSAEYWGPGRVDQDYWVHLVDLPGLAERWYGEQSPQVRSYLDAFVAGINDYFEQHPRDVPADSRMVLPIQPSDVLAHIIRVIDYKFVSNPEAALQAFTHAAGANRDAGSNAWALAPEEGGRANAMLLINPHLPWSGFFTWMEGHMVGPDLNFYGAALVGMPFMALGFNQYLGWTHTVNTIDAADFYRLQPKGDGYLWNGEEKPFESRKEVIKILEPDGSYSERTFDLKSSVQGPVLQLDESMGIALRVAGLDRSQLFQQYLDMARAKDLGGFQEIVARLQMPMFTLIYADRAGHILSLFGGVVPRRPPGDWNWGGIVPGTTSETLWEEAHVYGELPKVVDPASGWVQNANEPPWTTTLPYALDPRNFPSYMAPLGMAFRPQASVRLLREDPKTLEELVTKANSTRMELAERTLDDLLPILQSGDPTEQKVAGILSSWDRTADAGSRGSVLFAEYWDRLNQLAGRGAGREIFALPWDPDHPTQTPDGLAHPELVHQALKGAAAEVLEKYGSLDVAWGDIHRLRRGGLDFPGSGGSGRLGIFRVVNYSPAGDEKLASTSGDSFVAAAEFRPQGTRGYVLTVYGNSSKPDSIHYGDQLELFAKKEMRPALLTRAEAEAHKSRAETLHRAR